MSSGASSSAHPRFIDQGRVELISVIGNGAYGVVFLAMDYLYGSPIPRAVKQLKRVGLDARQRRFQRREIALHRLASQHPSIIHMDRLIEEDNCIYVIMDYGSEGDLFAMITDKQRYLGDDDLIRSVFLQILDGVMWLHSLGISHRDVKPENIVCSDNGTRVRLVDFGLATSEMSSSEFGCGSTFYIAPECLGEWNPEQTSYPTRSADIWSLGVILVNLVSGRNPWRCASPSDESFNAFLADPAFLRRILPISDSCLYILTQIFTLDPNRRISLGELRQLICSVQHFTLPEHNLRRSHVSVTPSEDGDYEDDEYTDESVFTFDDEQENETPSLRADSGSPSIPIDSSRSDSSNSASLPPTPHLTADGCTAPLPGLATPVCWETLSSQAKSSRISPSHLAPNPFFFNNPITGRAL